MGMLIAHHEGYWPETVAGTPAREPDEYDDLTDEQVTEAYAINVAGNATSRKGQLKALRALDAEVAALAAE